MKGEGEEVIVVIDAASYVLLFYWRVSIKCISIIYSSDNRSAVSVGYPYVHLVHAFRDGATHGPTLGLTSGMFAVVIDADRPNYVVRQR